MNKILRYSLALLFAVIGLGAQAQGVTIDFDNDYSTLFPTLAGTSSNDSHDGDFNEATTSTAVSGYTVTVSAKAEGVSNANRIWSSAPRLRMYSGTFTVSGANITKIEFTGHSTNFNLVAQTGTLEGKVWTGTATNEVVFTVSKNTQINKLVINGDGGEVTPAEGETAATAITVTRALELIAALDDGATTSEFYYVKGYAIDLTDISVQYGNATFTLGATATATDKLTAFHLKGFGNQNVTNADFIKAGDEVVIYGQLQKYVKDGVTTPEAKSGYVYSVNGKTQDDSPNPEDAITKGTTPETAMTAAEAMAYINDFTDGFTTTKQYYVKGEVGEVIEINTEFGNATFYFGNGLEAYRMKGLENKNITDENYIKVDDEVIILAKLQKYVSGETVTPELSSGYIYSLNGKTSEETEPVVLEGDGTKENPYTVADLQKMPVPASTSAEEGQEMVWVKGVIVGALNSAGTAFAEDVASNIAIAAAAGETEAANTIPVQLPTGDVRAALNVVDNAGNVGKEVKLYGYILKYMSRTGVKNVADYVLDGATGINHVTTKIDVNAPAYNLAGQRVDQNYRGVVIVNGKKVMQK
ncbi:MAG: hypothetical protein IJ527_04500 [Prevotella sp.]|nr:hypothetical protein [Prevotella sp.]